MAALLAVTPSSGSVTLQVYGLVTEKSDALIPAPPTSHPFREIINEKKLLSLEKKLKSSEVIWANESLPPYVAPV